MLCSLALHSERDLHDAFDGAHVLRTSAFFREAHATSTLSINIVGGGQKASGVSDRSDSDRPETCLLFGCACKHRLILHRRGSLTPPKVFVPYLQSFPCSKRGETKVGHQISWLPEGEEIGAIDRTRRQNGSDACRIVGFIK